MKFHKVHAMSNADLNLQSGFFQNSHDWIFACVKQNITADDESVNLADIKRQMRWFVS